MAVQTEDLFGDSLEIKFAVIDVKYRNADPRPLLARCDAWLKTREAAEWQIRDFGFAVSRQLDNLDRATDSVRAVRDTCEAILRRTVAA